MVGPAFSGERIDFSYSTSGQSIPARSFIRAIEAIGGQRRLKALYDQFMQDCTDTRDFFQAAVDLMQLTISADDKRLFKVPKSGPVVFIANHPYGVLDGIVLTWLARKARPDVKVMANHVLCQAPDAANNLLPVDFSGTPDARQTNINTRRTAIETLAEGGAIGIFPAGGVGASLKPHKGPAVDTAWHPFAAKMIKLSGATVIPVYFGGQNSRLFQIASHLSLTLRLSLFFFETARRIGSEVEFSVGEPITPEEIGSFSDRKELVRTLRMRTFALASNLKKPKAGYPDIHREFAFPKHIKV